MMKWYNTCHRSNSWEQSNILISSHTSYLVIYYSNAYGNIQVQYLIQAHYYTWLSVSTS